MRRNTCDLYFHDFSITLKLNFSFLTHLTSNKSGVMKRICQKGKVRFQGDTEIMKIQLILRHDVVSKHHVSSPGPKSCSDKRLLLDVFCADDQDPAAEILLELWNADKTRVIANNLCPDSKLISVAPADKNESSWKDESLVHNLLQ